MPVNDRDAEFVSACYRAILGRTADPAGFEGYLLAIRNGMSYDEVLRCFLVSEPIQELIESDESDVIH